MQKQYLKLLTGLVLMTFFGTLLFCATDSTPVPKQARAPENELIYYSDEFDKMREDLWDQVGYLYRDEQMQNYKQADMQFENGNLVIRTRKGSFSKGGLSSKFAFRGDFEIQLDCRMDFVKGVSQADMDQLFSFAVLDKNMKPGKMNVAVIGLAMKGGTGRGGIFSNYRLNGKLHKGILRWMEHFNGSLRIERQGKHISILYKTPETTTWSLIKIFRLTSNDMIAGFQFRNFFNDRTVIQANDSVSIEIDRFKVIAAKHIFYVMDCCYSGLGLNRATGVWPGISEYLRKVAAMRVVQIITAGGQGEQVQEREGHGLFTSYFLKAINGEADLDKDNVVTSCWIS